MHSEQYVQVYYKKNQNICTFYEILGNVAALKLFSCGCKHTSNPDVNLNI